MLDLAIVDKLNRAGFVVAPYSTPEEVPSVKRVSGRVASLGIRQIQTLSGNGEDISKIY